MPLQAGTRLGPYEIHSALGAGGMGEVYRARDTRLGRDIALKVVSESFTDPERLARFRREAQLLAALNHPHIATIHGLEESEITQFLVMELVEGDTLAERLIAGPIPVAEALTIAHQVTEALQAAHDKGIIHRDLKPANITVREDGTVKVLDFGLAKALGPAEAGHHDPGASFDRGVRLQSGLTASPTLSFAATQAGMILGTAAYMAPEQARGQPADKRADIWAFGCVPVRDADRQARVRGRRRGDYARGGAHARAGLESSARGDTARDSLTPAAMLGERSQQAAG